MRRVFKVFAAGAVTLAAATAVVGAPAGKGWISVWATAQDLTPPPAIVVPPPPPAVLAEFKKAPQRVVPIPTTIENQTIRMILRPTIAGDTVRIQLSNAIGKPALTLQSVHLAERAQGSGIAPGSDRALTFAGKPVAYIPPGAIIVSDPVRLAVRPDRELAVSLYVAGNSGGVTAHPLGLNPAYIVAGDQTSADTLNGAQEVRSYFWLSGLEAEVTQPSGLIVAFGDSITDGFATTPGRHNTWPEILADRLRAGGRSPQWSVVNMGISGNRVLRDGAGASGLTRFDRDVLSRPGAKWMIILEGVNDINMSQMKGLAADQKASADDIIAGLSAIVAKAHLHGIKVMGATITPMEGLWLYTPQAEATRQAVNRWVRDSGTFDAIADFDAATRDPARPTRLRPDYDSGDFIHPNDAGTRAMAEAIDLRTFGR